MRQSQSLKFAVLGVIAAHGEGVHGYAVKRKCDGILGHLWQVNLPEVYRALNWLAAEGWIETVGDEAVAIRKAYRITEHGKAHLDAFLLEPPTDLPRPVRQELAVKLVFSDAGRMETLVRVIDNQRAFYMNQLRALAVQRRKLQRLPVDSFLANLIIDGMEGVVRAEIEWLEKVCQKLTERFGAVAV